MDAPLTLRDIARQAGVSLATVDRVLHNRPGVRPDTVRRVRDAMERSAFQPHAAASELARARSRRFVFVMPCGANLFMQQIQAHLGEMAGWLSARRIAVKTLETDVFDPAILSARLEALAGQVDGVAVVALDHPSVRAAIDDLVEAGAKVVTLVSDVPSSPARRRCATMPSASSASIRCFPRNISTSSYCRSSKAMTRTTVRSA